MTILSRETLIDFLDLIADGATVAGASTAIGCAVGSKSAYGWLTACEEAAGELGEILPSADSPWCVEWEGRDLEFFHVRYREALELGKAARASRMSPLRAELQAQLERRRAEPPRKPSLPPRIEVFRADDEPPLPRVTVDHVVQAPIAPPTPAPKPRPSYAYTSRPLDKSGYTEPPPSEGRFSISRHVVRQAEREAGTVSFNGSGIIRH